MFVFTLKDVADTKRITRRVQDICDTQILRKVVVCVLRHLNYHLKSWL